MRATEQAPSPTFFAAPNPRNPLTRARIERLSSRAIAGFGLLFTAQVVPVLLERLPTLAEPWAGIIAGLLFGTLIWVAVAAGLQRTIPLATSVFAALYLLALATWPVVAGADSALLDSRPWLWYLCTVATAYAAIGMPLLPAAAYTVAAPLLYGIIRGVTGRPGVWESALLDSVYALVLGGVILIIVTMLRQVASVVDSAQLGALQRYSRAVREHAREAERVEVDAIVHDSVLTTLLAAANARSPQAEELAARMARDAIGHLNAPAEPIGPDEVSTDIEDLRERIMGAAALLSVPFSIAGRSRTPASVPMHAGEALYAAAVQAMVNSAQHAGGVRVHRRVRVAGMPSGGAAVTISDDGVGFDPATVPPERLGLAVSIVERMFRAGGSAQVRSSPGRGTSIVLSWPAEPSEGLDRNTSAEALDPAGHGEPANQADRAAGATASDPDSEPGGRR